MPEVKAMFPSDAAIRLDRRFCHMAKCRGPDEKSAVELGIPLEVRIFPSIRPSERYPV